MDAGTSNFTTADADIAKDGTLKRKQLFPLTIWHLSHRIDGQGHFDHDYWHWLGILFDNIPVIYISLKCGNTRSYLIIDPVFASQLVPNRSSRPLMQYENNPEISSVILSSIRIRLSTN